MLDQMFHAIFDRLAEVERRLHNSGQQGTVSQVDAAKGLMRLKIGESEGKDVLSPWVPYAQVAGALKVHSPPSVGQQMLLVAPSGDLDQAVGMPMTWSDNNQSPSQDGAAHVATLGNMRVEFRSGEIKVTIPKLVIEAGGGTVTLESGTAKFAGFSGIEHDGKNIGKTHLHSGVLPGGSNTGEPV